MNFFHLAALFCEYCIIPLLVWLLSYIPKSKHEKGKLMNYGYEFLLIVALAHFTVSVRCISDIVPTYFKWNPTNRSIVIASFEASFLLLGICAIISMLISIILISAPFIHYYRFKTLELTSSNEVYSAFNKSFIGWFLIVAIIVIMSHLYLLLLAVGILFIYSYKKYNALIRRHFVPLTQIMTEAVGLLQNDSIDLAISKLMVVIRETINHRTNDEFAKYVEASLLLAEAYRRERHHPNVNDGITRLEEVLKGQKGNYVIKNLFYEELALSYGVIANLDMVRHYLCLFHNNDNTLVEANLSKIKYMYNIA